ncbi:hypothetical protein CAPTEDRAFT_204971 [Capitella teleta]|uniref:Uncharacterized protein n=1 Tax=Capitella teleta TaxID=283909 RepID=R7TXF0_CAPTE|nr:hypothetical protein CAPTEDRAFT_204971 [Capitella teleta]|eukprot:ELT98389.1 hypothetical protein CAPTEDRAFT_204971 [Capitella teleta]
MCILGALVFILLLKSFRSDNIDWGFVAPAEPAKVQRNPELKHDNWIIVTTVQKPTSAMEKIVQIPNWQLLVVADKKTPETWSLPGAIFLDIRSQKELQYKVHSYLPYNSYSRKVMGYLYAIEHGAKYIYETDDDNFPEENLTQFQTSIGQSELLLVETKNATYNPLVHFGQGTMWPRGFPLDEIGYPSSRDYSLCQMNVPSIQQGLVNGDPDVDALFRLTRKHGLEDLDVKFDNAAPPVVLPHGTYSPFNSQNTLFTAKAFWALVLPVSVTMRECDIYRSYWAQTLMWTLGDNLGFYAPNAVQRRNSHSYIKDAIEETELYHHMGEIMYFMKEWKCDKVFFFDCVSQLTHGLVERGFFVRRDADLIDAWITDLATIGYAPPIMRSDTKSCHTNDPLHVVFFPDEQETVLPHSSRKMIPTDLVNHQYVNKYLTETCGFAYAFHWHNIMHEGHKFDREVLVISLQNNPEDIIPSLEATYRPHFPHILYCGEKPKDESFLRLWQVSYVTPPKQVSGVSCVLTAMRMRYHATAYIHITDTMYLNMHGSKLLSNQNHLIWMTGELDANRSDTVNLCKEGSINCIPMSKDIISQIKSYTNGIELDNAIKTKIQRCFDKLQADPRFQAQLNFTWVTDITFRVSNTARDVFKWLAEFYNKDAQNMKYDFFSLLLLECLEQPVEHIGYKDAKKAAEVEEKTDYLFPYPFKVVEGPLNQHYCKHFEKYALEEEPK